LVTFASIPLKKTNGKQSLDSIWSKNIEKKLVCTFWSKMLENKLVFKAFYFILIPIKFLMTCWPGGGEGREY